MRIQLVAFLLVLAMLTLAMPMETEAQVLDSVIYYMGENAQGKIVGGIVHNVSIALTAPVTNITLNAFNDAENSGNITTNYSWSYSNGIWVDNLYDYYIKNESGAYGNQYCFHIALDPTAYPGTWRWVIIADGTEVYNQPMWVEVPVAGISMSSPTFYPRLFPYGTGHYNSWRSEDPDNSTNLWTKNIGNVPLDLTISYDSMNSLFTTSNGTGIYLPGEEMYHYVEFQAQSWSPRKFTVKGLIFGEPQLVMTPNTISSVVAPRTTFDVIVTVARPGYDIYHMDGVTVQYKQFHSSKFQDDLTLDMYLTGNKSVYLSGDMQNLTLNFMEFQEEQSTEPILLALTEDTEKQVIVNITCSVSPAQNQASILTYANFILGLEDQTGSGLFTSTVVVASIPNVIEPPPILEANMVVVLILFGILGVIILFLLRAKKKTELERREELEESIRIKKEQARRQR